MAQSANPQNTPPGKSIDWSGISFERMSPAEFDNQTKTLQNDYSKAIINSDNALYGLLRHLYHTYLLAQTDDIIQNHVNKQVSSVLGGGNYDVRKQPEKNCFSKLITAYVAIPESSANSVQYHLPERSNTYAMAMHWALRQKWTPEAFFNGLNEKGIRVLRDDEIKARQNKSEGGPIVEMSGEEALKIVTTASSSGETEINISGNAGLNAGVNLLLAYVREGEDGQKIATLRQISATKSELENWVKLAAKAQTVDDSDAKQLLRTVEAGEIFFDRAPNGSERVTIQTTDAETFVCYSLNAPRSEKQVRFVVSRMQGVPDGLSENVLLGLPPDRVKDLAGNVSSIRAIGDWRFEKSEATEDTTYSLLADATVKSGDGSSVTECKQWKFLPDTSVKINKDISEFIPALDWEGGTFPTTAWLDACHHLKATEHNATEPDGKNLLQWVELGVGDEGIALKHQSAPKKARVIKDIEHEKSSPIKTAFTSGNLPNQIKKFLEQLHIGSFVTAAIGKYVVIRGTAQGVEYAVGFTLKEFLEKPTGTKKAKAGSST